MFSARNRVVVLVALLTASASLLTEAQEPQPARSKLHAPADFIKIGEQSRLTYELGVLDDKATLGSDKPQVLPPDLRIARDGDNSKIVQATMTDAAKRPFDRGEAAFNQRRFEEALALYQEAGRLDPESPRIPVHVADAYYRMNDFPKAKQVFKEAIARNPIDYQAHWFLADTLLALGEREEALREITLAHLMNVHHPQLKAAFVTYRGKLGNPLKTWEYSPRVRLSREGDKVKVEAGKEWIAYAIAKAIWRFEPGFAEANGCGKGSQMFCQQEELEAFMGFVAANPELEPFKSIVKEGYALPFIYYEVVGKKYPVALLLLPDALLRAVIEFVDRYR